MATPRADTYSIASGADLYAGVDAPPPPPTWETLTVASHSRYLPTKADTTATDSASPSTVTYVPAKAWQSPIVGNGVMYYWGGLHSDYPGNDIDACDLSAISGGAMPWEQLHRPRVPPAGDTGYGSGGSANIYKNYTTALADKSDWQPYARHYYCGQLYHPDYGLLMQAGYPVDPGTGLYSLTTWDGSDLAVGSNSYHADGRGHGIVRYDLTTGKYTLHTPGLSTMSMASEWHLSDYSSDLNGFLVVETASSTSTKIHEVSAATSQAISLKWAISQADSGLTGSASERQEGVVIRWMGGDDWIWLHKQGDTRVQVLKKYNHAAATASADRFTAITLPAGISAVNGGNYSVAVDRAGGLLYFMEARTGAIPRFWKCPFSDLGTWEELTWDNTPSVTWAFYPVTGAVGREAMIYDGGYLYLIGYYNSNQRAQWWRVYVG